VIHDILKMPSTSGSGGRRFAIPQGEAGKRDALLRLAQNQPMNRLSAK